MRYKVIRRITSVEELKLGGTYIFENTIYVYAGRTPMMGNAYTFVCELGTYYLNERGVQTIIDNQDFRLVKTTPEKSD